MSNWYNDDVKALFEAVALLESEEEYRLFFEDMLHRGNVTKGFRDRILLEVFRWQHDLHCQDAAVVFV